MKRTLGRIYFSCKQKMIYSNSFENGDVKISLDGTVHLNDKPINKAHFHFDRFMFSANGFDVYENDIILGGRCAALAIIDDHYGGYEFLYKRTEGENFLCSNRADFPVIKKVLGNKHENPELLELTGNNPQPYPEEDKVKYIDFSVEENFENFVADGMTAHLIKQEIGMYLQLGEKIDEEEFNVLCRRRGFNVNVKNFLIKALQEFEIGKHLQFDTTHESIKTA